MEAQLSIARLEDLPGKIDDHESRIRELEKGLLRLAVTVSVTGAFGAAIGSAFMKWMGH